MSLELNGIIDAKIKRLTARENTKDDGSTSYVTIHAQLTDDDARRIGGALFSKALFASFVGESGEALLASGKAGKTITIKHSHVLQIDGYSWHAKPKIAGVVMSTSSRMVTVAFVVPVPHTHAQLATKFLLGLGSVASLEFRGLVQPDLPNTGDDAEPDFDDDDLDDIAELGGVDDRTNDHAPEATV